MAVVIRVADGACPLFRADTGAPWKKGTGTEPATFFRRFGICDGSEPVPIFHSTHDTTQAGRLHYW